MTHTVLSVLVSMSLAQFVQVRSSAIAPCFWQSLVRCSVFAFGVQECGFFLKTTSGMFPYSILLGSTVDTCLSVYEAFLASTLQITADSPQLQFIKGRRHPCLYAVAIPYGPYMVLFVQKTTEIPQLLVDTMADVPFVLLYNAGYAGFDAPRAVFVSLVLRPRMLASWLVWSRWTVAVSCARLVFLVQLWSFRSCSSSQVEQDSSPSWRNGRSMVQTVCRTFFLPQVQYMMADVPVVQVELVSWCRRQGDSRDPAAVEKSLAPGGSGSSPRWRWDEGDFLGPCALVQGRGSCPQGHGLHN